MADALLAAIGQQPVQPECPLCYRTDGSHVQGCRVEAYLAQLPQSDVRGLRARVATLAAALEEIDAYCGTSAHLEYKVARARRVAQVALGRA